MTLEKSTQKKLLKKTLKKTLKKDTKKISIKSILTHGKIIKFANKSVMGRKVELTDIRKSDYARLVELTGKPNIMKYVGNCKVWDSNKVKKYINYTITDKNKPINKRDYFSFGIRYGDIFVGIIQFKLLKICKLLPAKIYKDYPNDVILTIYIDDKFHGKGIARKAIELLKNKIKLLKPKTHNLFSLVRSTNTVMNIAMEKLNFTFLVEFHNGEYFKLYKTVIQ